MALTLFDHLVGAAEQRQRSGEAERQLPISHLRFEITEEAANSDGLLFLGRYWRRGRLGRLDDEVSKQ